MFVFLEGAEFPIIQFDRDVNVTHIVIKEELTFEDAIATLASRTRISNSAFIFWNFFSTGCRTLEPFQKRGLERIALGDNAVEFHSGKRYTRFIVGVSSHNLRQESFATTVQSMMQDKTSIGIGNFQRGNTLIVGDTPGNKAMGYNTPFVGSGSGTWLLKQLESIDFPEDKYYWINSKDGFGIEANYKFVFELKPKKIIALGNEAAKWAGRLCNLHEVVSFHHPQFWLRFRSDQEYPLLKQLK